MAKRFTDTNKWEKDSFSSLSNKMKLVWVYLCDKCDHAGVWDINMKLLSFHFGEAVHLDEILSSFGDKITVHENKLILHSFIKFQYGVLNANNKVHRSVINLLEDMKIKPLGSPLYGAKDKDKEKDMDKDKEQDKDKDTASPMTDDVIRTHARATIDKLVGGQRR